MTVCFGIDDGFQNLTTRQPAFVLDQVAESRNTSVIVEYYIKEQPGKHLRYFASPAAARQFYRSLVQDPTCEYVRLID